MRPLLSLCTLLLLSGCARSMESTVESTARTSDASAPASDASRAPPAPGCQSDADCALTRIPEEGCCETLCAPRAVTASEARALEAAHRECTQRGEACPDPQCAPPRFRTEAVCTAGRCEARSVRSETR